jgi:hypothetical protein
MKIIKEKVLSGFDVVAFDHGSGRYCRECFESKFCGKTIGFCPVFRAVIVQSCLYHCNECQRDLREIK